MARMQINKKYLVRPGGNFIWVPELPANVLTPERIWRKFRSGFLDKLSRGEGPPLITVNRDHLCTLGAMNTSKKSFVQYGTRNSRLGWHLNEKEGNKSGMQLAFVWEYPTDTLQVFNDFPGDTVEPMSHVWDFTMTMGFGRYRTLTSLTPLGILRRTNPIYLNDDVRECRRHIVPGSMRTFGAVFQSRCITVTKRVAGGYLIGVHKAGARSKLLSDCATLLPEYNRDGDHIYDMPRRAWFERLEALGWGKRAEEAARRVFRQLAILPKGFQIQALPALKRSPGSAVIQVVSPEGHRYRITRLRILPDAITQRATEHVAAPFELQGGSGDWRVDCVDGAGSRVVRVTSAGVFSNSGTEPLGASCVAVDTLHPDGYQKDWFRRHHADTGILKCDLYTPDEAAGTVAMSLLAAGLPAA